MAARYCGDNAQRLRRPAWVCHADHHKIGFLNCDELTDGGFAFLEELFFDPLTNHGNFTLFVDIHLIEVRPDTRSAAGQSASPVHRINAELPFSRYVGLMTRRAIS